MKFKNWKGTELELFDFAVQTLDGSDYERGAVEEAQATADNTKKAFARLIKVLAEQNVLTRVQVYNIITGYEEK